MSPLVLILLLLGFAIACPGTLVMIRISRRLGALDTAPIEGQIKETRRPIPNTGGVAITAGVLLPMIAGLVAFSLLDPDALPAFLAPMGEHIAGFRSVLPLGWGLVGCVLLLHILGLVDDRHPMGAVGKLLIMLVPGIVCATLLDTRLMTLLDAHTGGTWASVLVTVFWFVAVTNAMNFIDNMDGLAGGVAAIAGALFLAAAIINGQWFVGAVLALLVGSCAGFLVFNFPPAKIFMGDGGSLVIGFLLAFLTTRTTYIADGSASSGAWYGVLMPLAVLAVPLYDMLSVIIIRLAQGKNPMVGDLQHFSHRMRDRGISGRSTVLMIYGLTAATGCAGLLLARVEPWMAVVLGVQIVVLLATLAYFEHRFAARSSAMIEREPREQPAQPILAWSMLTLLLTVVLIRTLSTYTPFPWWDGDPFTDPAVPTGLTPTTALAANLLMIVFSLGTVAGVRRTGGRVLLLPGVLIAVAQLVVVIHAFRDLNTLVGGTDLIAAACVGYACWHATQLPKGRAVIAGIMLGLVCVLGVIGLHQVLVQHPQTVAAFESNKSAFLESRGWAADSFQSRTFERRLMQADPTAWFGLTNVYASVVGAMGVGLLALAWRTSKDWSKGVLALLGIGGVGLVLFAGSTGAFGAVIIGLVILISCGIFNRVRTGPMIIAASGMVVLGVIARGFIGERIGELSILFRSQYMLGAWRAWMEHPILGVGSGNFQEAYARLKPPTSPEDVASPHSIGFDLISTLGLGGISLLGVFVAMVWSIGKKTGSDSRSENPSARLLLRVIGVAVLISFVLSIRLATGVSTLEIIGVQAIGTAAWFGLACLIALRAHESAVRWAMAGAAAVLMVHGQLDLTPTYGVSAALFAVMIGSAGGVHPVGRDQARRAWGPPALAGSVLLMALLLSWRGSLLLRWDWSIDRAGKTAHRFAMLDQGSTGDGIDQWHLEWTAHTEAVSDLVTASKLRPEHLATRIALTEQLMWLGMDTIQSFDDQKNAEQMWQLAFDAADFPPDEPGHSPGEHRWAGTVLMARAGSVDAGLRAEGFRVRAIEHWVAAFGQTPHDPDLALMIMDGYLQMGDREAARVWAGRAIAINERMHLDPLRQFDPQTLGRVRAVAE